VAALLPEPQLKTDAHPLVEVTFMEQRVRRLVHLVNLTGHSQTGYFAPIPMHNISIEVSGNYRQAHTVRAPGALPLRKAGARTVLTLPVLRDYELVVLE
jgi:hypothetical protein